MSGYCGGHILRLKLINFMTYDDLEIYPERGLNLIIGENGSGKSSIMCAICLGLGGKTQLTGRSGELSDFVKYGCEQAMVEIELENISNKNVIVTRIIKGNTSTWLLNKEQVTLNEIEKIVKDFNIDISNLCQFLPQEKVREFARMDKKARLDNMLQCIGDENLFTTFKELKLMKTKSLEISEETKLYLTQLEDENQKIERLKFEADKHEARFRLIEDLKSFKQIKLYLDYKKTKEESDNIKLEKKTLKKEIQELDENVSLMEEKINIKTQQLEEILEQLTEKNSKLISIQKDILERQNEISKLQNMVSNAKVLYENKIVEKIHQQKRLDNICKQKQELKLLHSQSLIEQPKIEERDTELSFRLEEVKNEISSLEKSKGRIKFKLQDQEQTLCVNTEKMKEMEKEENKKMDFLKEKFKDIYDAVLWLKDNQNKFKSQVHGPMFFVFNLESESHRKFVENCVSQNDLTAFVCEDREDFKLLIQTLRLECNLKVNVVLAPEKSVDEYECPAISDDLRELGVFGFMKDLIKAPDSIVSFLCECYKLHLTPLCNSTESDNIDSLLQNFESVVTPDLKFFRNRSKYGDQNFNTKLDPIWESEFIPTSKDYATKLTALIEKMRVEQELTDVFKIKLREFEDEISEKEKEENLIIEEKKAIQAKLEEFGSYEKKLELKTNLYEANKKELVNEESEKETLMNKVKEMCNAVFHKGQVIEQLLASLMDFSATTEEKLKCYLKARLINKRLTTMKKTRKSKEKQLKEFKEKYEELEDDSNKMKQKGYELMAELIKLVPDENQTENSDAVEKDTADVRQRFLKVIPVLQKMFQHHVALSELNIEMEIQRLQAKISTDSEDTAAAFNEYNERKKLVTEIGKKVERNQLLLKEMEIEMNSKREKWLPDLLKHVSNTNSKFSQYYAHIGCAGEISLDTCDDSDDFPNYGLQINVKYRESEPFTELSQAHHSGGECSVAAIIFILSLQDLTEVPFRCIDEINQGMDEKNERSIYDLIALNLKNEYRPQYFLLTPKLLVDLEMVEKEGIKVHVIFNASFLQANLDVKKYIASLERKQIYCD